MEIDMSFPKLGQLC